MCPVSYYNNNNNNYFNLHILIFKMHIHTIIKLRKQKKEKEEKNQVDLLFCS